VIDLPRFVADAFNRQATFQQNLERKLAEHLPPAAPGQPSDEDEAFSLICTWSDPTGGYRVLDADAQRETLTEMKRAADTLARLWASLHPSVRNALWAEATRHKGTELDTFFTTGKLGSLQEIAALPERIKRARPAAERVITKASEAGKTNWRGVSLVDECRDLWKRRTGRDAPRSEPRPSTAFYRFLEDVLLIFDAGRPVPAFRAWMAAHR
jgi:hypothetical protein